MASLSKARLRNTLKFLYEKLDTYAKDKATYYRWGVGVY